MIYKYIHIYMRFISGTDMKTVSNDQCGRNYSSLVSWMVLATARRSGSARVIAGVRLDFDPWIVLMQGKHPLSTGLS